MPAAVEDPDSQLSLRQSESNNFLELAFGFSGFCLEQIRIAIEYPLDRILAVYFRVIPNDGLCGTMWRVLLIVNKTT